MAATGDYFFSYTTPFQGFVNEKNGLFVFLCIYNELKNMYNKCDPCNFITKQTIITDFFPEICPRTATCYAKTYCFDQLWMRSFTYCVGGEFFQTQCLITCHNRDITHLCVYKHIFLRG